MTSVLHANHPMKSGVYCVDTENHTILTMSNPENVISQVIINKPTLTVLWADGTKTVVKCRNEKFDAEKGLAMAIAKKALGNTGRYYKVFREFLPWRHVELYANNRPVITLDELEY